MVRLKVREAGQTLLVPERFQFHNGSIKREENNFIDIKAIKFQFHNGSIKSDIPAAPVPEQWCVSIPQWFD